MVSSKVAASSSLLWTHAFTALLQSLWPSAAAPQPAEATFPVLCRRPCSEGWHLLQLQVWNHKASQKARMCLGIRSLLILQIILTKKGPIDWLIDWLTDCLIDWLINWLIDGLIDWLIVRLTGGLIDVTQWRSDSDQRKGWNLPPDTFETDQFRCIKPQHEALGNNYRICKLHSPDPRAEVYCFRLNFHILKLLRIRPL